MKCRVCGKPLSDPVSMALEIGPTCRMKLKLMEANDMNGNLFGEQAASFSVDVDEEFVTIIDHDTGRTVTNEARNIIAALVGQGIDVDAHLVIYRDTMGVWDRIVTKHGEFAGFESINERDVLMAKAVARGKASSVRH